MKKPIKIKLDPCNTRVHGDKNKQAISGSLSSCGAGRSVLIDSEGVLIAGNGVFQQAKKLGIPVRIIESDGTELVAIKRTDLKTKDVKRKALALADNQTGILAEWDEARLSADLLELKLEEIDVGFLNFDEGNRVDLSLPARDQSGKIKKLVTCPSCLKEFEI